MMENSASGPTGWKAELSGLGRGHLEDSVSWLGVGSSNLTHQFLILESVHFNPPLLAPFSLLGVFLLASGGSPLRKQPKSNEWLPTLVVARPRGMAASKDLNSSCRIQALLSC